MKKGICSQKELALHTHDRITFKRCRRKWHFSSPFGRHLQPKADIMGVNPNLWFGSAIHFALEDYHGFNRFDHPTEAFRAFVTAHKKHGEVPETVEGLEELGEGMLNHYVQWEKRRAKWKTVWKDGVPLVEMKFSLVLEPLCHYRLNDDLYFREGDNWVHTKTKQPFKTEDLVEMGAEYREIVYHGTIDRLVQDQNGLYWILDYKTARTFDTSKLPTDPQITAYCWAAEQWLDVPIEGMLYVQLLKTVPKPPRRIKSGISADKSQKTTHYLYREALIEEYGDVSKAPIKNIDFLNDLALRETEYGDDFIRYDWVPKNNATKVNAYKHILQEGREMIDPHTPLYPNPTRDCSWDCPFRSMCIAMDEGADWEEYLNDFEERIETMTDDLPPWMITLYRLNRDKYPEEYKKHCTVNTVDSLEEFLAEGEI